MSKENTKAWKILEFIGSKGKKGVGLTEIQHFIWTELDGYSEESFWEPNIEGWRAEYYGRQRKTRGHWCTALYGGWMYHTGLFHEYCEKVGNRKWKLVNMPKPGENIYKYRSRPGRAPWA